MARSITITVTVRWWLKAYLARVLLTVRLTKCEPDLTRVRYWVGKAVKTTVR